MKLAQLETLIASISHPWRAVVGPNCGNHAPAPMVSGYLQCPGNAIRSNLKCIGYVTPTCIYAANESPDDAKLGPCLIYSRPFYLVQRQIKGGARWLSLLMLWPQGAVNLHSGLRAKHHKNWLRARTDLYTLGSIRQSENALLYS